MESEVRYVTLGSGEWHTTSTWPPAGFADTTFYFAPAGGLSRSQPGATGADEYTVALTATPRRTPPSHTPLGGGDVGMSGGDAVVVGRQRGLKGRALCAVVNAAGREGVSHDDVLAGAQGPGLKIAALVTQLITAAPASW